MFAMPYVKSSIWDARIFVEYLNYFNCLLALQQTTHRSTTEHLALVSDSLHATKLFVRAVTDTTTVNVTVREQKVFIRTVSENLPTSASIAGVRSNHRQTSDTFTTIDSQHTQQSVTRYILDETSALVNAKGPFDSLSQRDYVARVVNGNRNLSDTVTCQAFVSRDNLFVRSMHSSFVESDTVQRQLTFPREGRIQPQTYFSDDLSRAFMLKLRALATTVPPLDVVLWFVYAESMTIVDDVSANFLQTVNRSVDYTRVTDQVSATDVLLNVGLFYATSDTLPPLTASVSYTVERRIEFSDFLLTVDTFDRQLENYRAEVDTTSFVDTPNALAIYAPPYLVGDRVQFVYNGAVCQGTVIQLLYGPIERIVIDIDVASNYAALRNLVYNRIIVNQHNNILTRLAPFVWY